MLCEHNKVAGGGLRDEEVHDGVFSMYNTTSIWI